MDVASCVADRYGPRASHPEPLAAGWWSRAYAFRLDGRDAVIRFGAHLQDFAKDRVMGEQRSPALPIPRVLDLGKTPEGYFVVSERAHGTMLDDLDGDGMRRVLPALLDALDALRSVRVPGARGYGLWAPDGAAPHPTWREALLSVTGERPRTPGWREALAAVPEANAAFAEGCAALDVAARDLPDVRHVIHCDLLYRNVMVQADRIAAVLDWGNALLGDPLYDAAWLVYWWPWHPAWRGIDIAAALAERWPAADLRHRLRCYQLHIGLDHIVWHAFTGEGVSLMRTVRQTLALARNRQG